MKKEIFVTAFWLVFSLYASIESFRLGIGTAHRPGPGFFPFGAAIAVGVISLLRVWRTCKEIPITKMTVIATSREWKKIVCAVASMLLYAYLLEPLGFVICTFLLMAFYLKVIAAQRWLLSLSFAAAVAGVSYLFFDVLLNAQLPRGILTL